MWPEPFTLDGELAWRRRTVEPPGGRVPCPDAEVTGRPDVEAPQGEEQEHVGGPLPHPPDAAQRGDHGIVVEVPQPVERHVAGADPFSQVAQRPLLGTAQPACPQDLGGGRHHGGRRDQPTERVDHPAVDRGCRRARQLLVDDGAGQCGEPVAAWSRATDGGRTVPFDEPGNHPVVPPKGGGGFDDDPGSHGRPW